jgi:hypothetical protein
MNSKFVRIGTCALWTIGASSCGAESPDQKSFERAPSGSSPDDPGNSLTRDEINAALYRVKGLVHDVGLGARGDDARAVHAYLTRFGYFPNEELAREHPGWRSILPDAPATADVYDQRTVDAVRQLQRRSSLPETGVVDEPTRAVMKSPRCGNPDSAGDLDPSSDFAYRAHSPLSHAPTWSTNDFATVDARIAEALDTWSADTTLSFAKSSALFPDIYVESASLSVGTLGTAKAPNLLTGTTTIQISTDYPMYYGLEPADIPAGTWDFRSLMLHELGHAINLGHSGFPASIMYSGLADATIHRELQLDDRVGASSIYDTWQPIGDDGLDIGVGKNGDVWRTAASNHAIWKWNPAGSWDLDRTGQLGNSIAVAPDGRPYVVAPNGSIWSRSNNDPLTGTWQELPGGGCARDIGVGVEAGDIDLLPAVWVIGCGADSDTTIWKHISGAWVQDVSGGWAMRITVDEQGVPWVTAADGRISRYSTNSPMTGLWSALPGAAMDIGIGAGNYAWAIGTSPDAAGNGWSIHSWNEQPAGPGNKPAPQLGEWRTLPVGAARTIAVGPKGDPWIINTGGYLFKTLK